jgi:hypothetical protein
MATRSDDRSDDYWEMLFQSLKTSSSGHRTLFRANSCCKYLSNRELRCYEETTGGGKRTINLNSFSNNTKLTFFFCIFPRPIHNCKFSITKMQLTFKTSNNSWSQYYASSMSSVEVQTNSLLFEKKILELNDLGHRGLVTSL